MDDLGTRKLGNSPNHGNFKSLPLKKAASAVIMSLLFPSLTSPSNVSLFYQSLGLNDSYNFHFHPHCTITHNFLTMCSCFMYGSGKSNKYALPIFFILSTETSFKRKENALVNHAHSNPDRSAGASPVTPTDECSVAAAIDAAEPSPNLPADAPAGPTAFAPAVASPVETAFASAVAVNVDPAHTQANAVAHCYPDPSSSPHCTSGSVADARAFPNANAQPNSRPNGGTDVHPNAPTFFSLLTPPNERPDPVPDSTALAVANFCAERAA